MSKAQLLSVGLLVVVAYVAGASTSIEEPTVGMIFVVIATHIITIISAIGFLGSGVRFDDKD